MLASQERLCYMELSDWLVLEDSRGPIFKRLVVLISPSKKILGYYPTVLYENFLIFSD
jgi:hypothetical protein